jgi:large subunit ribosomal protein L23
MRLYDIIKKPVITEKSSTLELLWKYIVEVIDWATKIDIKKAFKEIYKLDIESVNVLKTREKFKNWKTGKQYKRRVTKKAIVTLKNKKDKVDFSIVK